jgi:hypothetical protein
MRKRRKVEYSTRRSWGTATRSREETAGGRGKVGGQQCGVESWTSDNT